MSEEEFFNVGLTVAASNSRGCTGMRRFRSLFGCLPCHCSTIWGLLSDSHPLGGKYIHLLLALLFLRVYATESVNHAMTGLDEKTFRKWSWEYVNLLSTMTVVNTN